MKTLAALLSLVAVAAFRPHPVSVHERSPLRSRFRTLPRTLTTRMQLAPLQGLAEVSTADLKMRLLQLAASTDRGQQATKRQKEQISNVVDDLSSRGPFDCSPGMLNGSWVLVYASAQLFRSSPFFLSIQASYDDSKKASLFFKLHELQTRSWGFSEIAQVGQTLLFPEANSTDGRLRSDFNIKVLPSTVVPLVGWWKLLPTFGGNVRSIANASISGDANQHLDLTVDLTKVKASEDLPLMPLLGQFLAEQTGIRVSNVWKRLRGSVPTARVTHVFVDSGMRIAKDSQGEVFVYVRDVDDDFDDLGATAGVGDDLDEREIPIEGNGEELTVPIEGEGDVKEAEEKKAVQSA
ncbi:unnamed protein product [Vitrella brassicaformis CCMP3155]|uniref:Plastid lipid-associated protein/fibrillin conserved domain-containing protein n=1 Tax=Vitrella brassicaformis (strain CCMP3155) TaxID=1169540 RepID=A0A0G4EA07_VITBC|nr:unnamed protein product [Vitrella brassicaformis CCMP3155]|eukprot:CEL92765.1 unnamed protein product [Vitrella brassicaformis CCMP3155]